jgi:hypothetical protein
MGIKIPTLSVIDKWRFGLYLKEWMKGGEEMCKGSVGRKDGGGKC